MRTTGLEKALLVVDRLTLGNLIGREKGMRDFSFLLIHLSVVMNM